MTITTELHAVVYNPVFVIQRAPDTDQQFTSAATYKMTTTPIHDRVSSEWAVDLSKIIDALSDRSVVGWLGSADVTVVPEVTPLVRKRKKLITSWLRATASLFIPEVDTSSDDKIAEDFFRHLFPWDVKNGTKPIKLDERESGVWLIPTMYQIPIKQLFR